MSDSNKGNEKTVHIIDAEARAFEDKNRMSRDAVKIVLITVLVIMTFLFAACLALIIYTGAYKELPGLKKEEPVAQETVVSEDVVPEPAPEEEDERDETVALLEEQIYDLQEKLQDEKDRNEELQQELLELAENALSEEEDDWLDDEDMDTDDEDDEDDDWYDGEDDEDDWEDEDDDWDDEDEDESVKSSSSSQKTEASTTARPAPAQTTTNQPHTMTDRDGNTHTFTADEWNYLLNLYRDTKNPAATAQDHTISELLSVLAHR